MNKISEDTLRSLLKDNGMARTTEEFSADLTALLVHKYSYIPSIEFKAGKWLGKMIIAILVSFNVLLLCYVGIYFLQPVIFTCLLAVVLGVWGVIGVMKSGMMYNKTGS
jgi:hypothetical protein